MTAITETSPLAALVILLQKGLEPLTPARSRMKMTVCFLLRRDLRPRQCRGFSGPWVVVRAWSDGGGSPVGSHPWSIG